jgi:hypothetical protein
MEGTCKTCKYWGELRTAFNDGLWARCQEGHAISDGASTREDYGCNRYKQKEPADDPSDYRPGDGPFWGELIVYQGAPCYHIRRCIEIGEPLIRWMCIQPAKVLIDRLNSACRKWATDSVPHACATCNRRVRLVPFAAPSDKKIGGVSFCYFTLNGGHCADYGEWEAIQ